MNLIGCLSRRRFHYYRQCIIWLFVSLCGVSATSARVVEIGPDKFTQYGENEAYWEVVVACGAVVEPKRIIRQNHNESRWCSKNYSEVCDENKQSTAELICGTEHTSRLNDLNQERLSVERKRQTAVVKLQESEVQRRQLGQQRAREQASERLNQQNTLARQEQLKRQQQLQQRANARPQLSDVDMTKVRAEAEDQLIEIDQQLLQIQTTQLGNRKKLRAIQKELSSR